MTNAPAFRQIAAPLDVPDAELDQFNRRMGVPMLVPPGPATPSAPATLPPATPVKPVNVHLPAYVVKALKDEARNQDCSVRYIIMCALVKSGIAIDAADLVQDARRANKAT